MGLMLVGEGLLAILVASLPQRHRTLRGLMIVLIILPSLERILRSTCGLSHLLVVSTHHWHLMPIGSL